MWKLPAPPIPGLSKPCYLNISSPFKLYDSLRIRAQGEFWAMSQLWSGSLHQQSALSIHSASSGFFLLLSTLPVFCLLIRTHHLCLIKQVREHKDSTLYPWGYVLALQGTEYSTKGQALSLPPESRTQVWHPMGTIPGKWLQGIHSSNPCFLQKYLNYKM